MNETSLQILQEINEKGPRSISDLATSLSRSKGLVQKRLSQFVATEMVVTRNVSRSNPVKKFEITGLGIMAMEDELQKGVAA